MTKINNYHLYDFQEQPKFNGLANEVKAESYDQSERIAAIEKKNVEQDNDIEEAKKQDKFVESADYNPDKNTLTVNVKNGNSVDIPLDGIFKDSDLVQKSDFDTFVNNITTNLSNVGNGVNQLNNAIAANDKTVDNIKHILGTSAETPSLKTQIDGNHGAIEATMNRVSDIEKNYVSASTLNNYYTKRQTSGSSEIADALATKSNTGHTHTLAEITDYTSPDLSAYYLKAETSGATEIQNALDKKQDTLTVDDKVNDTSTNPIQNKAIYEWIIPKEKTIALSLNDLHSNKLDTSAYTEYDDSEIKNSLAEKANASDVYSKSETSGATEIQNALNEKQDKGNYVTVENISENYYTQGKINDLLSANITSTIQKLNDDKKLVTSSYNFSGNTLNNITSIVEAIQKIADKLDSLQTT